MRKAKKSVKSAAAVGKKRLTLLEQINFNTAGIDVGSREHWVAVPCDRDPQPVRCFGTFTSDLQALADWLLQCGVKSVAMESTGVYWIPVFQILEKAVAWRCCWSMRGTSRMSWGASRM